MNQTTIKEYELFCLMPSELSDVDVENKNKTLEEFITELGGEIKKIKPIQKKRLAYVIDKNRNVNVSNILFAIDPKKIGDLNKKLKLENTAIRYLITRYEPLAEQIKAPLPLFKPKAPAPSLQPKMREYVLTETERIEKEKALKEIDKKLEEILNE